MIFLKLKKFNFKRNVIILQNNDFFFKKKLCYCFLVEILGIHPEDIKIILDFIIFLQICTKIKESFLLIRNILEK